MSRMKIVVLDAQTLNPGDNPWDPVAALGDLTVFDRTAADQIVPRAKSAQVILTNKTPIRAPVLTELTELKMVSVLATGYDVVDVEAAASREILVCNVPVYSTRSVAQHVFGSLLGFLNRPEAHDAAVRRGEWAKHLDFSFSLQPLTELAGHTMGIVGYGRIGKEVARLADAFGMSILCHTRSSQPQPKFEHFQFVSLEEVFQRSDMISLNCPQTPKTTGMVNRDLLERMKPTAILINASRGGLVCEPELADALNQERIRGAILDVVSKEPIEPKNPLFAAKNCLLTPHHAWATFEARQRLMKSTADNIAAFQSGQPINVVNL